MPGEILSTIPECINLISDSIYNSSIMNINQLDENIRKLAAQQNVLGWNFFDFFLTKESKALTLSDLGLLSEALVSYDELETLFLDIYLHGKAAAKFNSILPVDSKINGSDLSQTNWVRYRELMHQNQISLYEFRVYLLSRQIHILRELKDYVQLLSRCKEFVCQSVFIAYVDNKMKCEWTLDVIFFILKMIDFDPIIVDNNQELSDTLSEILILADSNVKIYFAFFI